MNRDPADDRDEPTDEEITAAVEASDCVALIMEVMDLTNNQEMFAWCIRLQDRIHDAVNLNRENQKSDGDE